VPGLNDHLGATGTWSNSDASSVTAWFDFADGGTIATAASPTLSATDPIVVSGLHIGPSGAPDPHRFLLVDGETRGVEVAGAIDVAASKLTLTGSPTFSPLLAAPVAVHGNVVDVTRGERVPSEVLGSGDASLVDQTFTLAKKPLTYLPSVDGNDTGVTSTLEIRVSGLSWTEVPTFFGQPPDAPVFTVRENDEGKAVIAFGDGVNGARVPTGVGNVVATYRFGAGASSPPAGSITQLARSIPGVKSVVNPVGAAGGADAEAAESLRKLAPRSALLLGRAVSILDMEAAASVVPGVRTATARWEWDGVRQRPVVKIWYVGDAALAPTISQRLRSLSDPSTPFDVQRAGIYARSLAIDVETDPRRIAADVAAAVKTSLLDPDHGLLAVEQLGIGKALFRSRIFEAVEAVPGALGVRALSLGGAPFISYGYSPPSGTYFYFEPSTTKVTGSPKDDVITA
jgi:predicted phage baseplate assembly protein